MSQDAAAPLENGRYRLIDVLGEGGMATVYRAWDARLEVWRAIKVLDAALTDRPNLRTRFENEARTMARLHHRNIVTVHDVGRDGPRVFMVMELVEGGSLVDWVETHGPMPPRMAMEVLGSVLVALQIAHDNGVVHRDIKPHNILIDREGTPKVSDFGIARVTDTDHSLTKTGAMMGTWTYMAPEQRTSARRVDARADVYAAGATLYALVTAREPFDLYTTELHPELFAAIPEDIAAIIKTACRYKPEDRFDSANAMRDALIELRGEYPTLPAGTPPLGREDSGSFSAPPPAPLTMGELAASGRSDPTFHVTGHTVGGGALQEVSTSPTQVPHTPAGATVIPDGTLSDASSPAGLRSSTSSTTDSGSRMAWAPWVLVLLMSGVVVVLLATLGGVGYSVWGGNLTGPTDPGVAGASPAPEPAVAVETPEPQPEPAADSAAPSPEPAVVEVQPPEPAVEPAPAPAPAPRPPPRPVPVPAPETHPVPTPAPTVVVTPKADPVLVEVGLNSLPYFSTVRIDGEAVGRTPWSGKLPEGRHEVLLEGSKGGRIELPITLTSGEDKQVVCWDYAREARCARR